MEIIETIIDGIKLIVPDVYGDSRGFFYEVFNYQKYPFLGDKYPFVQDNVSYSKKGTIRGLHYQAGDYAQGKLCTVFKGEVMDVAVDVRFNSPTFGKYFSTLLSAENKKQIWIPPGFAHGFSVISEDALFLYKCTAPYNKQSERSIRYDDPDINIEWNVENPIVSDKDLAAIPFREIEREFIFVKH